MMDTRTGEGSVVENGWLDAGVGIAVAGVDDRKRIKCAVPELSDAPHLKVGTLIDNCFEAFACKTPRDTLETRSNADVDGQGEVC
jgi:hypothetical protein